MCASGRGVQALGSDGNHTWDELPRLTQSSLPVILARTRRPVMSAIPRPSCRDAIPGMALIFFLPGVNYWQFLLMPCSSSSFRKSQVRWRAGWYSAHIFSRGGFPSLDVLSSCLTGLGGQRPTGVRNVTHMMGGRQEKRQGLAWYGIRGPTMGGKALIPALPRFLFCATLFLAAPPGGFIQKMSPSHTQHTHTHTHFVCTATGNKSIVTRQQQGHLSFGPRGGKIAEPRRTWGRQLAIRPVGTPGGHKQKSPVLGTPRRSIWGSSTGWTG